MSWIETWLDTATAPSLATILAALQQSGARGINFYLGGRFSAGAGWAPELSAELAQQRPDVGQLGTWVSLSPGQGGYDLGHQDGLDAVAAAKAYPAIRWLDYDVEPVTWQANPQGVDDAMRGFADAAHAAGYHVMDYGTPATVAGASNEDLIWIANPNPGGGDPAVQPLNPAYYVGRRAVQYGTAVIAGVTWDVTHSEFSLAGTPAAPPTGGSSAMTIALAPRPDGSGVDIFSIAADGSVGWEGDVPDWVEGAEVTLPGTGPGAIVARGVAAAWESASRLVVVVVGTDGVRHLNAITTADWKPGAWEQLGGTWLVPAATTDLLLGPAGPAGPSGPPGPTYDDSGLQGRLGAVESDIKAIKAIP